MTRSELTNISKDIDNALHIYQETFGTFDGVISALEGVIAKYGSNDITDYLKHLIDPNTFTSEAGAYKRLAFFSNGLSLSVLAMKTNNIEAI